MSTRILVAIVAAALVSVSGLLASASAQNEVQIVGGRGRGDAVQQAAPAPPSGTPMQFEVASIKPNKTGGGRVMMGLQPGGRMNVLNMTLRDLVQFAYQVQPFQIVGGPSWLNSDRFDISAKAESEFPPGGGPPAPGGPPGVPQQMLQALLRDRFKLAVHTEMRDMPVYDLVLNSRDGKLGDKLKLSTLDCAAMMAARRGGGPPPAPGPNGTIPCGMRIGPGLMSGNGVSMAFLANSLSQMVQRVVTDKTGLKGDYEFNVTFTPDGPQAGPGGPPPGAPALPPVDPNAPSIYTAVQEQLGLKLEGARGQVLVLIVDKAEPPTPD